MYIQTKKLCIILSRSRSEICKLKLFSLSLYTPAISLVENSIVLVFFFFLYWGQDLTRKTTQQINQESFLIRPFSFTHLLQLRAFKWSCQSSAYWKHEMESSKHQGWLLDPGTTGWHLIIRTKIHHGSIAQKDKVQTDAIWCVSWMENKNA